MTLDLGCGDDKRGDIGVDHLPWPGVDHVVNLGFEPLPFPDNHFDRVYAWDFFEHLPKGVYYQAVNPPPLLDSPHGTSDDPLDFAKWKVHHPHILVFNEAWRVLKPNCIFDTFTPIIEPAVNGRLFHFSTWNLNQFEQFTAKGTDFKRGHMKMNGFIGEFEIESSSEENLGIHVFLRAIK